MAISKDQPLRPYVQALGDALEGKADESNLSALTRQVLLLSQEVDDLEAAVPGLQSFLANFKIGMQADVTVPANDSYASSVTFAEPFGQTARCALFADVITDEVKTLFELTIIDCSYSGFSYSVSNSDEDDHVVSIGYMAVKVG